MILIECSWCETELVLASLDVPSVDCPACHVSVEFSPEPEAIARAA
ncbi:MAG TPA: hypothetical protein VM427_10685 [Patescibacteria group bacterium]|nr:hypothetical protein [Patescibacteria group bacterium]